MRKILFQLKKSRPSTSPAAESPCSAISRRGFLGSSALVVLPALCGGCAEDGPPVVDLPAIANKQIVVSLADFPALAKVGGSIHGRAIGYSNPIVIARVSDTMFAALDSICTHERCTVTYNALNLTLDCPCHGSTYEVVDGSVINGPALLPLKMFAVQSDGTNVTIMMP